MAEKSIMTPEGKVIPVAEDEQEPMVIEPEPEAVERVDPNADLFEVPQPEDNDIRTDHLFETEGMGDISGLDDDMSDLFDSNLDREPEPQAKKRYKIAPKYSRVNRQEPPATMGGLRV